LAIFVSRDFYNVIAKANCLSSWSYNFDEDPVGEIDIIEGINDQSQNVVSLHTCGACKFTKIGGLDERSNCNNGGTESDQCEDGTNLSVFVLKDEMG
jgi:hypothetical protein